jgi:serine kinase of HPr protein (carbohydrate metabolism regulator)
VIIHGGLIACRSAGRWRGALLVGPSGAGKSDLALRALDQGFQLVADDRTRLFVSEGRLFGRAPTALFGLMEVRGVGIVGRHARLFCPVSLTVRCKRTTVEVERLPDPSSECFLGVDTPAIDLWPLENSAPAKIRRAIEHLGVRH